MKIKDILNENNIQWLYETTKIVDNINKIANNIHNTIMEKYNSKKCEYYEYTHLYDDVYSIPRYFIKFWQDTTPLRYNGGKNIYIECTIYICRSQEEVDELVENNLLHCRFVHTTNGPSNILQVNFELINNKYKKTNLLKDISHEITHFFQRNNNTKISSEKDEEIYNKQYNNITRGFMENSNDLRNFSYINNVLTRSEISANINGLYTELMNKNITKNNYIEIYKQTKFYDDWNYILNMIGKFRSFDDNKWNEFKNLSQKYNFYKKNMKLSTTNDIHVFKDQWYKIVNKMIKYTNNSINQVIYKAIEDKKNV